MNSHFKSQAVAAVIIALSAFVSIVAPSAQAAPPAMPLISQGVPAYASDNSGQASLANNSNYDDTWRSNRTPSSGQPCWLAYDLSSKSPHQVAVTWYNPQYGYEIAATGGTPYNIPQNYTIEVNSAKGGTVPSSGWVTKATVTNNDYHSRTVFFDMTGDNWIRFNCSSIIGSSQNYDASLNMDVFDARNGTQDTWMFYGDSITAGGMNQTGTTFAQSVHSGNSSYYPSEENGGVAGWKTGDLLNRLNQFLAVTPAHYVTLSLGTNDVNTYAGDNNAINTAYNNLASMANTVLSYGKVPIIPHMPWARIASIQANAPMLNSKIDALCASNHSIILGPDLYGYFNSNQGLISSDNLHPSNPAGFQAYRNYWASWALANIYNGGGGGGSQTIANGTYKIANRNNGGSTTTWKVLEAYYAGTANGTVIDQYSYNGGNTQKWNVTYLGSGQYSIVNANANKPLEVTGSSGGSGTWTELWDSNGGSNQKWVITATDSGWYRVSPAYNTGLALDVYGASTANYPGSGSNGRIDVYTWSGNANQQWAFWTP